MTRTCPLCGKSESEINPRDVTRLPMLQGGPLGVTLEYPPAIAPAELPNAWRAHLASCAGGDEKRAIAVTIPFEVVRPVSPDTNHVTYRNAALGLEYRFYYPDYLDRDQCAARIASVQPYPEFIVGAAPDQLPRNELCDALMQWRALVASDQAAKFSYEEFRKLNEAYNAHIQGRVWYRVRRWLQRLLHGERAAGVRG